MLYTSSVRKAILILQWTMHVRLRILSFYIVTAEEHTILNGVSSTKYATDIPQQSVYLYSSALRHKQTKETPWISI